MPSIRNESTRVQESFPMQVNPEHNEKYGEISSIFPFWEARR
jgi:hypothetical protein